MNDEMFADDRCADALLKSYDSIRELLLSFIKTSNIEINHNERPLNIQTRNSRWYYNCFANV